MLTYRVLARDQPALVDLVFSVLNPLVQARGGAGPLVETLARTSTAAVSDHGRRQAAPVGTRRDLPAGPDQVLDRIRPADPAQRFTLQAAVLGAKLLGWPDQPLPGPTTSA